MRIGKHSQKGHKSHFSLFQLQNEMACFLGNFYSTPLSPLPSVSLALRCIASLLPSTLAPFGSYISAEFSPPWTQELLASLELGRYKSYKES